MGEEEEEEEGQGGAPHGWHWSLVLQLVLGSDTTQLVLGRWPVPDSLSKLEISATN